MASLQTPLLVALILLAVALQTSNAGPYGANVEDTICCNDYIRRPLPLHVVKEFFWTSKSCRKPGIVRSLFGFGFVFVFKWYPVHNCAVIVQSQDWIILSANRTPDSVLSPTDALAERSTPRCIKMQDHMPEDDFTNPGGFAHRLSEEPGILRERHRVGITRGLRSPCNIPTLSYLPHPGLPAKGLGKYPLVRSPQSYLTDLMISGKQQSFETRQHRNFCANPKEQWVQDAMKYLDRQTTAPPQNGGKFEKLVNMTSGITVATRGLSPSALAEPEATVKGLTLEQTTVSQEAQSSVGTSQEPPAAMTGSPSSTSKAQDAGLVTRPQSPGIFEEATISTTIWQSSAVYQSESRLQVEEKPTEPPSTTAPSTQEPTTSHSTLEENVESEVQPTWVQGQNPSLGPEESLGSEETSQAHTIDFQDRRSGNTVHPTVAPTSSEGTPSWELVPSGSWPPKSKEPIPATSAPQKRSVFITPVPDSQAATRRQAVGLLAFLGLLFCLGVAMFAYQSLQGCPRKMAEEMVEGLRYVPRSCGSNSYVLVPV
ncbi:hypothetical protein STEG23_011229 [Scotinomys teguina]